MKEYDIAVIGGGLAGTAAAVAIAKSGQSVAHFAPPAPPDKRTSALMAPTVDFLVASGLIPSAQDQAEPLRRIRMIDATKRLFRAPETLFDASEAGLDTFGWNFANAPLLASMSALGETCSGLTTIAAPLGTLERADGGFTLRATKGETFTAQLVIGADGKKSRVRAAAAIRTTEHTFKQSALVCDVALGQPLEGTSIEFHYENGPFTLVPAGGKNANLVWIDTRDALEGACALPEPDFDALLRAKSQNLFGKVNHTNRPIVFPLSSLSVATAARDGIVLVGEAAHAFPPIGAQGLNLGLRDVAALLDCLSTHDRGRTGWAQNVSQDYAASRSHDLLQTGAGVDALFRSLLADFLPVQAARAGTLWALRLAPGLRKSAFAIGMGAS